MNRLLIISLVMCAIAFASSDAAAASQATTRYQFNSTTPLASGKWVKISVTGTGLYEISYDRLREMGFTDPQKVTVYGTGGALHSLNFNDNLNRRLVEDGVQRIATLHSNNKLIFYALGDAKLNLQVATQGSASEGDYCFKRTNKNTYSFDTYYMLTDSQPVAVPPKKSVEWKDNATEEEYGYGCIYHEKEIEQGRMESGGIWVGENIHSNMPRPTFPINAKYYVEGKKCIVNFDIATGVGVEYTINIDFNGTNSSATKKSSISKILNFADYGTENLLTAGSNFTGTGNMAIYCSSSSNHGEMMRLDYFTVAYPASLGIAAQDPAFDYAKLSFPGSVTSLWKHPVPAGAIVWDVTNPISPVELDCEDGYFYSDSSKATDIVAFNPSSRLRQINDGFAVVANTNLHALQTSPCDLLIFTTEEFRPYARRLADMRRESEGLECIVVTDEELYNEFNAGTPEANCYRMMAKMLYQGGKNRLKNVLFFGPLTGDLRNCRGNSEKADAMIAYQDSYEADLSILPNIAMDYYGIVADKMNGSTRQLRTTTVTLGVGVLPVQTFTIAESVLKKFQKFYNKEDFSGMVNEFVDLACRGSSHLHENQSISITEQLQAIAKSNIDSKFLIETMWTEPLTKYQVRDRIKSTLHRGKLFFTYFGHSGTVGLSSSSEWLMPTPQFLTYRNPEQGLAMLAGCDLTNFDRGVHGFGDLSVTSTQGGFIGAICSGREVESRENFAFVQNIFKYVFNDANNRPRTAVPTIGEIVSLAKSYTSNNSKIAYMYIGDPSMRIPLPLQKVTLNVPQRQFRGGETVEITGTVNNATGETDSSYNGYVTVKIVEPERSIVTQGEEGNKMNDYVLNDLPILAVKGEVKDGKFSVKVPLPASVDAFTNEDGTAHIPVYAGTYDKGTRIGACGVDSISLVAAGVPFDPADPTLSFDKQAPSVNAEFNAELGVVTVTVTDDIALMPGIGRGAGTMATLNGKQVSVDAAESNDVAVSRYEAHIDVAHIGAGNKATIAVTASDIAGNTTPYTAEFVIPAVNPMKLTANSEIAVDNLTFNVDSHEGRTLNLIVSANDGTVVANHEFSGPQYQLDTTEIPAGTYRAAVRSNSPLGSAHHSNWVVFTVID